jgi:hypothetical protein
LLGLALVDSGLAFDGKFGVNQPKDHNGPCPAKLVFIASFASDRAREVDFVWTRSDGVEVPGERLVLAKGPDGFTFGATSSLEWQVSTDKPDGEQFIVGVKPSTTTQPVTSRPVKVVCTNGGTPDPRPTESDVGGPSTEPVSAAPGAFDLGAVSVLVVGADNPAPAPPPAPAPTTQTFTCPMTIQLGVAKTPAGFAVGEQIGAAFLSAAPAQGKLVCRYRPAGTGPTPVVAIEMAAPQAGVECGVSGRQFTCGAPR